MLSRVAENLYWLGRYLERAENVARMIDVEYHVGIENGALAGQPGDMWNAIIAATGSGPLHARARRQGTVAAGEFLVLDSANSNSIRSTIGHAREVARTLREHISREVWHEINTLYLDLGRRTHLSPAAVFEVCASVRRGIETVFGLYDNTVLFDEGRDWFRCGFFLERADMTSRVLDAKYHILLPSPSEVGGVLDRFQWMAILRSVSAAEAFRKLGDGSVSGPRVASMLILQPQFPRSLAFCVMAMLRHYRNATALTQPAQRIGAERELTLLHLDLSSITIDSIIKTGLHEFLGQFQQRLVAVNQAITDDIFRTIPERV